MHIGGTNPIDRTDFHILINPVFFDGPVCRAQRGKPSPPSARQGIGEHAVGVGLNHLSDKGVGRRLDAFWIPL